MPFASAMKRMIPRLRDKAFERQVRFISQQIIEDLFGKIKGQIDLCSNARSSMPRIFALAVDSHVVDEVHHFTPVDRTTMVPPRNVGFDDNEFKPPLQDRYMDKDMKELRMRSIMGFGPAEWFSPSANNAFSAFTDIITGRYAKSAKLIPKLKDTWLCRLMIPKLDG